LCLRFRGCGYGMTRHGYHEGMRLRVLLHQLYTIVHIRQRTTPGKILFSRSAAHCAFGLPPSKQSSKSKSGCRTGFEYDTRAESTKVMFRMPQPCWSAVRPIRRINQRKLTISDLAT
jgi:hypothetical protein